MERFSCRSLDLTGTAVPRRYTGADDDHIAATTNLAPPSTWKDLAQSQGSREDRSETSFTTRVKEVRRAVGNDGVPVSERAAEP
jgi:hypothetical protein